MQREARIYAVYACLGLGVLFCAVWFAFKAWSRFGPSGTFAIYFFVALVFAALSALSAFISFSFLMRAVGALTARPSGFELHPARWPQARPLHVHRLRHIRTIGKQLSQDESAPAFVFFSAAGKVWVAEAGAYAAAVGGVAR